MPQVILLRHRHWSDVANHCWKYSQKLKSFVDKLPTRTYAGAAQKTSLKQLKEDTS